MGKTNQLGVLADVFTSDASNNVGIGGSPSAWSSGTESVLQVKKASIYEYGGYETALSVNTYYDGAWKYISTGSVTQLQLSAGDYIFRNAASGTAGTSLTWRDRMIITNAGNVGIGTSSPIAPLHIYSANQNQASNLSTSYSNAKFRLEPFNTSGVGISMGLISPNVNYLQGVYSDGSTTAPFTMQPYGGSVGVGTISPSYTLDVTGTGRYTSALLNTIQITNTGVSHGMTGWAPTNTVGSLGSYDAAGNFAIIGFSSAAGQSGLSLFGFIGVTDPTDTVPAILLNAGKKSGTAQQALSSLETTFQLSNAGTAQMTILGSGNVGIGTTTPPFKLSVAQDITNDTGDINAGQFMVCGATTNNKRLVIGYDTNGSGYGYIESAYYNNTWTYTALQPTAGNVVIGTASDLGYKLGVNGSAAKPGGGSWSDSSDARLKKDIKTIENALDKINKLNPVNFEWINPEEHHNQSNVSGFIAQEMKEVFPDFINEANPIGKDKDIVGENEKIYALTLSFKFDAYLVKAIQELSAQNQDLKSRLDKAGL